MKFSEAVLVLEQDTNKCNLSVYKNNHKGAFAKYGQYYPDNDPLVTEVFSKYDDFHQRMSDDNLSPCTLRNYTSCYKILLTCATVSSLFELSTYTKHLQSLDAKMKEADKLVLHKRQQKKMEASAIGTVETVQVEDSQETPPPTPTPTDINDESSDDDDSIDFDTLTTTPPVLNTNLSPSNEVLVLQTQLCQAHKHNQDLREQLIRSTVTNEMYKNEVDFLRSYFSGK